MDRSAFVYVTYIATTPEKLWKALTDGEFTRRYWGRRRIQSDWHVGSLITHVREDGGIDWQGEVLQSEPPRLPSYTFHMQLSDAHRGEGPSRVTFELQPIYAGWSAACSRRLEPNPDRGREPASHRRETEKCRRAVPQRDLTGNEGKQILIEDPSGNPLELFQPF